MQTHYVVIEHDRYEDTFTGTIYHTKAYAERVVREDGGRLALLTILEGDD